jgi:hypothetical protein
MYLYWLRSYKAEKNITLQTSEKKKIISVSTSLIFITLYQYIKTNRVCVRLKEFHYMIVYSCT